MSDAVDFIVERLSNHYAASGLSSGSLRNDVSLLRRLGCHPDDVTIESFERVLLSVRNARTRSQYAKRYRSIFRTLRRLELTTSIVDERLVTGRTPRSIPRPLSPHQVDRLLSQSSGRVRDWFVLGCYAGLRAMEVSGLRGDDLMWMPDGPLLRIRGKGGTDLTVPVAPMVAEVVESKRRLGRLYELNAANVSKHACEEMRRILGGKPAFHQCRHYFATQLMNVTDGDITAVKELMRHSNIQTTLIYTKLDVRRQRRAVDLLGGGGGATASQPPDRVAHGP